MLLRSLTLLGLLAACRGSPSEGPPPQPDTGDGPGDSAPEGWEDAEVEVVEGADPPLDTAVVPEQPVDDASWLFASDVVHSIAITLPATSASALYADPYTSVPADVAINDEPVLPSVGVRLRGKIGSFRTLDGKPKFEITFNEFTTDQRFYGLESLSLNNSVVDCSFLKEAAAYEVIARAGVPASRTGFAEVTVNGAPYGLYTLVETPDDRFLKARFEQPDGNLYDGKYVWYGGWHYVLLDFNIGVDELFQLEEGVDVQWADIKAISAGSAAARASGDYRTGMDGLVDWDEVLLEIAAEEWVGQNDGYALNRNNYRVYFRPEDGRLQLIPWDMDYSFLRDSDWGFSWRRPTGELANACLGDNACREAYRETLRTVVARIDTPDLLTWFDTMDAATWEASQRDPRQECGAGNVRPWRDYVRSWLAGGNQAIVDFWRLDGG